MKEEFEIISNVPARYLELNSDGTDLREECKHCDKVISKKHLKQHVKSVQCFL